MKIIQPHSFFMWNLVWMPPIHFMIFIYYGFYVNWLQSTSKKNSNKKSIEIIFKKADDNKLHHFWIISTAQPDKIIENILWAYIFYTVYLPCQLENWQSIEDTWTRCFPQKSSNRVWYEIHTTRIQRNTNGFQFE